MLHQISSYALIFIFGVASFAQNLDVISTPAEPDSLRIQFFADWHDEQLPEPVVFEEKKEEEEKEEEEKEGKENQKLGSHSHLVQRLVAKYPYQRSHSKQLRAISVLLSMERGPPAQTS